jgi:hypothetical protein
MYAVIWLENAEFKLRVFVTRAEAESWQNAMSMENWQSYSWLFHLEVNSDVSET